MNFVEFPQVNQVIAEDQPQYLPIPVYQNHRIDGHPYVMCLELNPAEREQFLKTGKLHLTLFLGAMPAFPPILNSMLDPFENNLLPAENPEIIKRDNFNHRVIELGLSIQKIADLSGTDRQTLGYHLQIVSVDGYASNTVLNAIEDLNIPIIAEIAKFMNIPIPMVAEKATQKEITSPIVVESLLAMVAPGGVFSE